jgi:hypothetical protein
MAKVSEWETRIVESKAIKDFDCYFSWDKMAQEHFGQKEKYDLSWAVRAQADYEVIGERCWRLGQW